VLIPCCRDVSEAEQATGDALSDVSFLKEKFDVLISRFASLSPHEAEQPRRDAG